MTSLHRNQQHHRREHELEVASSSSSSSDESDGNSDSDNHSDSSSVDRAGQHATPFATAARSAKKNDVKEKHSSDGSSSSSSSSSDEGDGSDDESEDGLEEPKKMSIGGYTNRGIDDVPLSEQIRRRQEVDGWGRGGSQQEKDHRSTRAERKSRAIESAQQLLAKMKSEKKKKMKASAENVEEESKDEDDSQGFFAQQKNRINRKKSVMESDDESDVSVQPNDEDDGDEGSDDENQKTKPIRNKRKKNKHKPTEVSSKRADFFRRGAPKLSQSGVGVDIGANRYRPLDPRMSNLTGHYNEEQFQRNYEFLEQMRNQEIGQLRKRITAWKTTGDKGKRLRRKLGLTSFNSGSSLEEDEAKLKALTQQRADLERSKINREARQSVKRKLKDDVESGQHGAFFLKRREKKRLELEAKLEVIRKRKGDKAVNRVIEKRRKKQKAKDSSLFAK